MSKIDFDEEIQSTNNVKVVLIFRGRFCQFNKRTLCLCVCNVNMLSLFQNEKTVSDLELRKKKKGSVLCLHTCVPDRGRTEAFIEDVPQAGIACCLERRTRDRKVARSNPGRSGGIIFFSRVSFVC